jgi:hypothetical protein
MGLAVAHVDKSGTSQAEGEPRQSHQLRLTNQRTGKIGAIAERAV